MQRRNRLGKRPTSSSSFRWLWWLVGLLLVCGVGLMLLAPSLVTSYIRAYVQKDDFRQKAENLIVARTGGSAHIAPIIWNDDTATATDLSLANDDWEHGRRRPACRPRLWRHPPWKVEHSGCWGGRHHTAPHRRCSA